MSSDRKSVKLMSFAYVIIAVLYAIVGGITLAGRGALEPGGTLELGGASLELATWALVLGVLFCVTAAFYLVYASFGIRGANNPRKIGS